MKDPKLVVGLMSGTSLDGVDAALVEISGSGLSIKARLRHLTSIPFMPDVHQELLKVASGNPISTQTISHLNFLLGALYSEAVFKLCQEARVNLDQIDLIGSHGQTVFHQSEPGLFCGRMLVSTLQIGEASILAENTGITTVSDFRPRDMAAGGKGAPLIPYVDYVLFHNDRLGRILLNVGGIANVTSLSAASELTHIKAFDTGPGNMVMDGLVRRFTGGQKQYDDGGEIASRGKILSSVLEELLASPYFQHPPPKTAGREQFGEDFLTAILKGNQTASFEDLLCTVAELTAQSIAGAIRDFILPQAHMDQLIVSGGGARNPYLLQRLRTALAELELLKSDDLGVPSSAKEAMGFAILANETIHLHPANVPMATGASHAVVLGKVVYGNNYLKLRDGSWRLAEGTLKEKSE